MEVDYAAVVDDVEEYDVDEYAIDDDVGGRDDL